MTSTSRPRATGPTWPDGTPRSQNNAFATENYVGQIDWTGGAKAAATKIKAAKELVAGQEHELAPMPAPKGSMGGNGGIYAHMQRGAVGRRRMKEQGA